MTTDSLNIYNIIILFGAFQGLVVAFILLSTQRIKKKDRIPSWPQYLYAFHG